MSAKSSPRRGERRQAHGQHPALLPVIAPPHVPPLVFPLAVAVLAFTASLNTLWNHFAYDDIPIIVESPLIRHITNLPTIFTTPYWYNLHTDRLYRPLVTLSYAINYAMSGLHADPYHLVNLLLHTANAVLVYWLVLLLFKTRTGALVTAALFAVHPIHTEAIANVVGRAELLSNLFLIASWIAYIRYTRRSGSRLPLVASLLAFTAALATKEHTVILPALLILTDALQAHVNRTPITTTLWTRCRTTYLWYLVPLAIIAFARLTVLHTLMSVETVWENNPLLGASIDTRLLTALSVLGQQMWLLLVPLHLTATYTYNQLPLVTSLADPKLLETVLAICALVLLAIYTRARYPAIAFSLILFGLTILPTSNLVMLSPAIMTERTLYLPSLGFCLFLAALWDCAAARSKRSVTLLWIALILLLGTYSTRTWLRNPVWDSNDTLYPNMVHTSPRSTAAYYLLTTLLLKQNDLSSAQHTIEQSLAIYPTHYMANLLHAYILHARGQTDAAILVYQKALRLTGPNHHFAPHLELGLIYAERGRTTDALQALQAAAIDGTTETGQLDRLATAFFHLGAFSDAERTLRLLISFDPGYAKAHYNLGVTLSQLHQPTDAAAAFITARRLDPTLPPIPGLH